MNQDNPFIPDFHAADSPVRKTTWYSKDLQEVFNLSKQKRKSAKVEAYQRLAARLAVNVSKISACQLSDQQFNNFKKLAADIIDQIPEEIINENKTFGITPGQKDILNLFHQEFYESRRPKVEDLAKTNLIVNAINFENEELIFDCWFYHNAAIARGDCKIIVELDGTKIPYKTNHIFSKTVYFGRTVNEKFSFQFKIPTKNLHENSKLNFFLVDTHSKANNKYLLNVKFNNSRPSARLSQKFPHSYWLYKNQKAVLRTPNSIIFKTINHKKQERKLYRDFLKHGKKSTAIKAIALRMLYHIFHKLTRGEQIWLTFDKLYKAGDNGEYFFQYCQKHPRDHVECFYILDKKSNDYARLKNDKHVLKFKSLRSRLVALNATAVFATHADAHNFLGIHKTYEEYLRDLLNYDLFCIQHGLTIQDIPNLQNRLRDNTKLYFLASPLEAKNLAKPDYNYDKSQLVPAGLARFDGLKGKAKKQILLAPTWRSSMANENTVAGSARPYFDEFKKTDYYQVFQSLLNNQQLKNAAEKYNYEIIYLLHPTLISQAKDFSTNSNNIKVKVPTGNFNYETALKESRLMVTDYSGVQYDFAYQQKPIIYFHPDSLPAHYDSSINYETQGFGPIVKTEDALVAALEDAMENDCKNPPKFQKRAEKFFYFHDQKSCARIYQFALKYIKKKGKMFNIFIRLMEAKNGNLEITGQLFNPEIDAEECAKKESNKDYDPLKKFLGAKDEKVSVTIKTANQNPQKIAAKNLSLHPVESKSFTLEIPLIEKSEISFSHTPEFRHALSHINPDFKSAYWIANDEATSKKYFVTLRNQKLYIKRYKKSAHVRKELKYLAALAIKGNMFAKKCAIIRTLYWFTKSHYSKKPIWLFEDKIYKGGDNGEYLYDYARQQKDGIKKFYVLNKNSIDARRFKQEGKPFVKYCSFRHKLIYLNADIVFNTHNGSAVHHSFSRNVDPYFRDLFSAKNVCIQHGLSVQNIPNLVNRINDNLQAFFLASPVEYKNLLGPGYAWKGYEDRLFLTGCPRYDGLKSHDKRVILITPTWRNYLAVPVATINSARARSADFKNTDYFKIYNSLINDPKLLQAAKEYNYKIVYLLHPVTASQINDFDRNDQVELIASTADFNYEKALTESSLMVTDYSGVQFDFAFQNKPIIYYHPKKLPPSYDEGAYKYQTMAFGDIVETHKELVDKLISAMKNNCKQPKKYQARVEKFFAYTNRKNCQRIYKTIIRKFY